MTQIATVLAATDLSGPARHAVDRAARVARETHAPLCLLHVVPGDALAELHGWIGGGHAAERAMREEARERLQALAAELAEARGIATSIAMADGAVVDELLRVAEREAAGLVVVGARGSGFLRRLVPGTTAERVMRRTTRPVLIVRQAAHEPYRRVLVAVDFSAWTLPALHAARRVAPNARLLLMSAFQVPFGDKLRFAGVDEPTIALYRDRARAQALERLHELARRAGLPAQAWDGLVVEGDASLRIVELEQESDCDLTVLGKHGLSAGLDLLLGSVTRHVLAEGSADVLVSTGREG